MNFKEEIENNGGKYLQILKHERESDIIKVIHKFEFEDRKYRIALSDGRYYFEATKYKSRYFHAIKVFQTLEDAENFIFTSECGDRLP